MWGSGAEGHEGAGVAMGATVVAVPVQWWKGLGSERDRREGLMRLLEQLQLVVGDRAVDGEGEHEEGCPVVGELEGEREGDGLGGNNVEGGMEGG